MQTITPYKRLFIATFGCQMNEYDSARMAAALAPAGYAPAASAEEADLILVNTCSVRELAAHKVYSLVGSLKPLKERRPGLRIGVGGCLAQQEGKRLLQRMPHLDLVFGTEAIESLPELVDEAVRGRRLAHTPRPGRKASLKPLAPARPGLRAMVTVMQGCNNFCSYCVVPHVRGPERSRPGAEVLEEAAGLAATGTREITLLGQNVNSYRDAERGWDFSRLLEAVAAVPGVWRVRFTTSHPKDLSPRLLEVMAGVPEVMEQLHLPAQSGSDRMLKAMNRGYTAAHYLELAQRYRRQVPGGALGGDLIAGFPGETDEDHQASLEILRRLDYDFLFSFKYSDRPLAKARRLGGKLSEEVKRRRLNELQALQSEITARHHRDLVGSQTEVLAEGPAKRGPGMLTGRDRAGRAVNFPGPPELAGHLVEVLITEGLVNSLRGRPIARPEEG
jgi:tRNA-2-methylthio-N6-dimethylallyladenosine synthase